MSSPAQLRRRVTKLEESRAQECLPNPNEVFGLALAKLAPEEREILRSGPYAAIKAQHPALWRRLDEALASSVSECSCKIFMDADDLLLL